MVTGASQLGPGKTLGRYEITSRLASGGMAEVWLAQATGVSGFRKQVVIKTILPSLAENPEFTRMFIQEALVASGLNHPNIVQIFDLGECEGHYYIAMEHVPGRTMRQILKANRARQTLLPQWFVIQVISSVCEGLHYAHELRDESGRFLGLVHRDISPENIMVSYAGMVKVLDFGIAKADSGTAALRSGGIKGKHAYMAPEVFEGKLDRRTDIFALGVMLYELLTGVRPYQGKNMLEIMWQIAQTVPPPPSHLCEQIPWELERIILDAIERDPVCRVGDAAALQKRLNAFSLKWGGARSPYETGEFVQDLFREDYEVNSSRPTMFSKSAGHHNVSPDTEPRAPKALEDDAAAVQTLSYRARESQPTETRGSAGEKDTERSRASWPSSEPEGSSGKRHAWADAARSAAQRHKELSESTGVRSIDTPLSSHTQPTAAPAPAEGDDATVHFERGLRLTRQGLHEDALREWELAMRLDPQNRSYEVNVRKLKKKLSGEG